MSETREYFQRKYPEFIDDIERRFNFTIGNLPVPTNDQQWLDLVKLVYSGASAAKDASIRDYMNICEDLSRKLEEARGRIVSHETSEKLLMERIAELEAELKQERLWKLTPDEHRDYLEARYKSVAHDLEVATAREAAKDARIAELEAAIKPFADLWKNVVDPVFNGIVGEEARAHDVELWVNLFDLRNLIQVFEPATEAPHTAETSEATTHHKDG